MLLHNSNMDMLAALGISSIIPPMIILESAEWV